MKSKLLLCTFTVFLAAVATPSGDFLARESVVPSLGAQVAELRVRNIATETVSIVSCELNTSVAVDPGTTKTLVWSEVGGWWIVPSNASIDCHDGPFDFYYIATLNDTGMGLRSFIGAGVPLEASDAGATTLEPAEDVKSLVGGNGTAMETLDQPADQNGILGLVLLNDTENVTCFQGACGVDEPITAGPSGLVLVILGDEAPTLELFAAHHFGQALFAGRTHHSFPHRWPGATGQGGPARAAGPSLQGPQ